MKPVAPRPAQQTNPAQLTSWVPMTVGSGIGVRMQRLIEVSPGRLEFHSSWQRLAICWLIGGFGITVISILASFAISGAPDGGVFYASFAVLAAAFSLLMRRNYTPRVFDRTSGLYWRGFQQPAIDSKHRCRLVSIRAVQILREVGSGRRQIGSYELNLVLNDGRRMHLAAYGRLKTVRDDAIPLAQFLGCKIWDSTDDPRPDDRDVRLATGMYTIIGSFLIAFGVLFAAAALIPGLGGFLFPMTELGGDPESKGISQARVFFLGFLAVSLVGIGVAAIVSGRRKIRVALARARLPDPPPDSLIIPVTPPAEATKATWLNQFKIPAFALAFLLLMNGLGALVKLWRG